MNAKNGARSNCTQVNSYTDENGHFVQKKNDQFIYKNQSIRTQIENKMR